MQVTILKGNKPTDQGIVFVINEGTSQKIWKVDFVGNEFASDGQLRNARSNRSSRMMIFKGFVDREQIDARRRPPDRLLPLVRLLPGQGRPAV